MRLEYAEGATPLDPDTIAGLIPTLALQAELNAFEAENISMAVQWAKRARGIDRDVLQVTSLRKLHQRMFSLTWQWAGQFRRVQTNIGVSAEKIPMRLEQLCGNVRYQKDNNVFPWKEMAVRFHHELVLIHPFPNGNGRHARLATDLLLERNGQPRFTWGSSSLTESTDVRREYIDALREADQGSIERLSRFVRT